MFCCAAYAQNITVKGTVVDQSSNEPVPYASVVVEGTKTIATTDELGNFQINAPKSANLVISSIGYTTITVPVNGKAEVKVVIAPETEALDDVVVVAYGTAKKESVTGAVATVKAEAIEQRPISSVTNALEGTVSGVMVNSTYGEPGSDADVRIRGFGSVNGSNAPLYIIDGVPFGGNVSDLNPQDIESLTVLKDATSAALYGSRASNGVILITTKRGKTDKVTVNASINQGIYARGIADYSKLKPAEWMQVHFDGLVNGNMSSTGNSREEAIASVKNDLWSNLGNYNIFNLPKDELFDANGKFNSKAKVNPLYDDLGWYDAVERKGHRQEYNISAQGASDKSNYYFSMGYLDEKGQIYFSDFNRWTGRANVNVNPTKWFKAGLVLGASMQQSNGISTGTSTIANPLYFAQNMAPIYPIYIHDPETGEYVLDDNGNKQYDKGEAQGRNQLNARHAIWENELDMKRTNRWTTNATISGDFKLYKDLTFSIKGDVSLRSSNYRSYSNSVIGDGHGSNGRASRTQYWYKNYTFQQLLNWNHEWGKHHVEALVGHETYDYNYEYQYIYKTDETFFGRYELDNFNTITSADGYQSAYKIESFLSRVKYDYNGKYYVEASFRRDGTSRFHPDNRWGNFWSVGGTWIISKEDFIKNVSWIDNLKLRASFGQVGNCMSSGYYSYLSLYTKDTYAGAAEAYKTQNAALDLVWESENSLSVALEGRLFNRFNWSVEYFDKTTKDLIFDVYQPLSAGATSTGTAESTQTMNLGSVANRGWEFNVDVDIFKTKNFTWNVGANATVMKNKILTLPEQNREAGIINGTKRYVEGGGIYDYWMYQYVGVDQLTGRCLYEFNADDYYIGEPIEGKTEVPAEFVSIINGRKYVLNTTYAKKDWSGSSLPKIMGSFSTNLSWKNLSFSALVTYQFGSKVVDYNYQGYVSASGTPHTYHIDMLKSWQAAPAGMTESSPNRIDPNGFPAVDNTYSTYNNATSTRFQFSGDCVVIKNVTLSYKLPRVLCDKISVSKIQLNASVDNLATFTAKKGMNSQQSFAGTIDLYFNTPRVISVGLNVTL
ncbi:MAG: TonB-dependent receptor [Bacteroidales bacterium]|nr:TonB-dependent receptor [Candidatus Egerieousia equi]